MRAKSRGLSPKWCQICAPVILMWYIIINRSPRMFYSPIDTLRICVFGPINRLISDSNSSLAHPGLVSDYAVANDMRSPVDWSVCWIGNPRNARLTDLCHARHVTGAKPLVSRALSRSAELSRADLLSPLHPPATTTAHRPTATTPPRATEPLSRTPPVVADWVSPPFWDPTGSARPCTLSTAWLPAVHPSLVAA